MALHTIQDLKMRQALPLDIKVSMTQQRIREWINQFGVEGVYVSFSGGKDSTVLLHLVREMYPDVPAVFVDTGLEYPEIREFVKSFDNVEWLKPKMNFKQVIQKYGYPFISKETSGAIEETNKFLKKIQNDVSIEDDSKLEFLIDSYENKVNFGYEHNLPIRALQMIGKVPHKEKGVLTGELSQMYDKSRWGFLLNAPFKVSNLCCNVMKKTPIKDYAKRTGRYAHFTGMMADESLQRQSQWLKHGCNAFDTKYPQSSPLSFWKEQDVLQYIKDNNIKIASVYGDIVPDYNGTDEMEGQVDFSDLGLINDNRKLKTTGCNRTGCMFCGYGCHLEKSPNRFEQMKETHPKQYEYIMKPVSEGGLGYKEVIDWINEHGNLNIKY